MTPDQRINRIALTLRAAVASLCELYGEELELQPGKAPEIILVVGIDNMLQYGSNVPREHGMRLLAGLLGRWDAGLPEVAPGEVTPGDTRPFEYLLNAFEQAAQHPDPASQDYAHRRADLLSYVGGLAAAAKR